MIKTFITKKNYENRILNLFFLASISLYAFGIWVYADRDDVAVFLMMQVLLVYSVFMLIIVNTIPYNTKFLVRLFIVITTFGVLFTLARSQSHSESLLLLHFIPMISYILLATKEATIWTLLFLVLTFGIIFGDVTTIAFSSIAKVSIFMGLMGSTTIVAFVFTYMKNIQAKLIQQKNEVLTSKQNLETIVNETAIVYAALDVKGCFSYLSSNELNRLDTTIEQVIGKHYCEIYSSNTVVVEQMNEVFLHNIEGFQAQLGTTMYDFRFTQRYNDSGKMVGYSVIAIDISDMLDTKRALKESNHHLQILTETAFEALILTQEGVIMQANEKAAEILGYMGFMNVLNKHMSNFVTPGSMQKIAEHVASGDTNSYEIEGVKKDGSSIFLEVKGRSFEMFGQTYRLSAIQSIQPLHDANEKIAKLGLAVEQSNSMIMITDVKGVIEYVNKKFMEVTLCAKEDVLGKKPSVMRSGVHDTAFFKVLWDTLLKGEVYKGEIHNKRKDGALFIGKNTISSIKNSSGEITHFIAVQEDVTHEKAQQRRMELQTKQAQLGEMLSMIAHQWRQPLATISAISAKVQFGVELERIALQDVKDNIVKIDKQVQYLSQTIDDFRNFYKNDTDKSTIGVQALVDKTLAIVEEHLKVLEIEVIVDDTENIKITSYINELIQVLLNVIKNSMDQVERKGLKGQQIHFTFTQDDNTVTMQIEDMAGGVDSSLINDVFLPYVSTKKEKQGTGLGLHMSRTIVEDHCNGKIYLQNSENGAVTTIVLPKD